MENNKINLADEYQELSDIDHVLLRPGVYAGNMYFQIVKYLLYKPSDNKIVSVDNVGYNAGLLKLFDEILTNSLDAAVSKKRLFDITKIDVIVNSDGYISIKDSGGIPVQIHPVTKVYLPKMIFGRLRTSGNYQGDREGAGLNGLGSKLTNIFSEWFRVQTCDGKKHIDIKWNTNMKHISHETVTDTKEHYTHTEFKIELSRFDVNQLDIGTIRIMQKRCIDAAATHPGMKISFKTDIADGKLDSNWEFTSFREFVELHENIHKEQILEFNSPNGKDNIIIVPSIGFNFGFVNGAVCSEGTHIKKLQKAIVKKMLAILEKQDIELITDRDINRETTIFVNTNILNPDYDSQAKDKLSSPISSQSLTLSNKFLDSLKDSEIHKRLVDFYNVKYLKEQRAALRKLNAKLKTTKSKKLITCNSSNKNRNELWLFEGTSASNGFQLARDTNFQACYLLRGKVKNTFSLRKDEIVENQELREIIAALNLQFNDPKGNLKNCNYSKIIIATDADNDGSHITGLLLTFFAKNFPELFIDNRIYRALSPIVVAQKGKQEKFYYTLEEFEKDQKSIKGWEISYKKGLGSLEDHHYYDFVENKRLEQFFLDKEYMETIKVWFDKSTEQRKEILGAESNYSVDTEN